MKSLFYSTINQADTVKIKAILIELNLAQELIEITNLQELTTKVKKSWSSIIINSPYQVIGRQRDLIIKLLYQLSESNNIPLYFINTEND